MQNVTNFFRGLMCGAVGFVSWFMVSVVGGIGEGIDGERDPTLYAALWVAFAVMTLGPLLFWVVVPLGGIWARRRRKRAESRI